MKYIISDPATDTDVCIAYGGIEVYVLVGGTGILLVDVTAPGKLDPKALLLDEDGDAYVAYLRNGEQQLAVMVSPGDEQPSRSGPVQLPKEV